MSFKNKTTQKIISALILILIIIPAVLFSIPKQVNAQIPVTDVANTTVNGVTAHTSVLSQILLGTSTGSTVTNTGLHFKDFATAILQQIAITTERTLLKQMTQDTVNWINTGFHGSPLFVQNPNSLLNNIAQTEIKNMIGILGYNPTQYPFGENFALNIINQYKQTFANNAAYTLSAAITDPTLLNNYRNNFNVGGWNGFLINTQYPQNNYLGFQMLATQQLARQLAGTSQNVAQTVQRTLQQGQGFLSPKICVTNSKYNNLNNEFSPPSVNDANQAFQNANPWSPPTPQVCASPTVGNASSVQAYQACTIANQTALQNYTNQYNQKAQSALSSYTSPTGTNNCPNLPNGASGFMATTPGYVVASQINTALGTPFGSGVIGSQVTNSIAAIIDTLVNHFIGQGLTSLASTINPPPAVNTFSYEGQTLTGGTTPTNPTGALTISQNAFTSVGNSTTVAISGGTGPYTIGTPPDSTIATAQISGSTLTIKGVGVGSTSVSIIDSSSPIQSASAQITISATGSSTILNLDFTNPATQNISIDSGVTANVNITGGNAPYIVQTQPDANVAVAEMTSDTALAIASLGVGQSSFVIQDSSGQSITVFLIVNSPSAPNLSASQQSVSISSGTSVNIILSGGTPSYTIQTQPDSTIASAQISGNTLAIIGAGPGTTSVIVQDSSYPIKTIPISIVIGAATTSATSGTSSLGTCTYYTTGVSAAITTSMDQTDCANNNGIWWTENTSSTIAPLGTCSFSKLTGIPKTNVTQNNCLSSTSVPGGLGGLSWTANP